MLVKTKDCDDCKYYLEEQADDCALSNETFSYAVLNKDDIRLINAAFKEPVED